LQFSKRFSSATKKEVPKPAKGDDDEEEIAAFDPEALAAVSLLPYRHYVSR
jgi:hypothetical protein